ncbi:FADD protein, partial [Amia calva]|nr:FADD protein [Amia calva]
MSPFLDALLQISRGLSAEDLDALRFLAGVKKKKLEQLRSGTDLFRHLMEQNQISEDDTALLRGLLQQIHRQDLVFILDRVERNGPGPDAELPDAEEREKLDITFRVLHEKLGKDWKMFARRIGLTEPKLDHIREKHPYNLEEQVMEALKEWRKIHKKDANVSDLIKALRDCRLNHTADLVEKELKTNEN